MSRIFSRPDFSRNLMNSGGFLLPSVTDSDGHGQLHVG